MNSDIVLAASNALADDRRISQLHYLCHFLEVFASGDPIMRAAASHYGERLRDEGCNSNEVIKMAATALLVAIEQEIEKQAFDLGWQRTCRKGFSTILADSPGGSAGRRDQAA